MYACLCLYALFASFSGQKGKTGSSSNTDKVLGSVWID